MTDSTTTLRISPKTLLSDVPRRLFTIGVGVPALWFLWSFHPTTRRLFFQGAHVVMGWEWAELSQRTGWPRVCFVALSTVLANIPDDDVFLACLVLVAAALPIVASDSMVDTPQSNSLFWLAGLLLVTTTNRTWLQVSTDFHATVSILLTVWNADTGALVAGRLGQLLQTNLPKPRWLQQVSPSKSSEGLIGGFVVGVVTYWSLPWFWTLIHMLQIAPTQVSFGSIHLETATSQKRLITGAILSASAILGDLWESSLKRMFQAKDSGKLLPGHGGVLDRFDSSLVAVMVYRHLLRK